MYNLHMLHQPFSNERWEEEGAFLLRLELRVVGRGIQQRLRFYLDIPKILQSCDFTSNFHEMTPEWLPEKNFRLLRYEHITHSFKEARYLEILNM